MRAITNTAIVEKRCFFSQNKTALMWHRKPNPFCYQKIKKFNIISLHQMQS